MKVIGITEMRQMLINYLHDNQISLNQVSKDAGIHQPNLHVFINGKGLSVTNMEKLYNVIRRKPRKVAVKSKPKANE